MVPDGLPWMVTAIGREVATPAQARECFGVTASHARGRRLETTRALGPKAP